MKQRAHFKYKTRSSLSAKGIMLCMEVTFVHLHCKYDLCFDETWTKIRCLIQLWLPKVYKIEGWQTKILLFVNRSSSCAVKETSGCGNHMDVGCHPLAQEKTSHTPLIYIVTSRCTVQIDICCGRFVQN